MQLTSLEMCQDSDEVSVLIIHVASFKVIVTNLISTYVMQSTSRDTQHLPYLRDQMKKKQVDMKPVGQPEQAGCGE